MRLRVAVPADEAAVSGIFGDSYPRLMAPAYDAAVLARALPFLVHANPALLASGQYFVAEAAGGAAVGCGGWTREAPGRGPVVEGLGHLRHFATRAGYAGRGIGRRLFECCAAQARGMGVEMFECWSTLNGEAFYEALGFAVCERRDVILPEGIRLPSVVMRRPLAAAPPR